MDSANDTYHCTTTDYQGSWCRVITDAGVTVERYSFDPWGRRRHPDNWNIYYVPSSYIFDRGYTGHEMLDAFGLINMNGRVYDPIIARFLSPDNYVQAPDNSQGFNRYSYALNNPLVYTDPDGEFVHLIVGAIVGGTLNWIMNGGEFSWEGLASFGIGALAGALGAGVGAGVNAAIAGGSFGAGFMGTATVSSTGFIAGFATGAAGGATNGLIQGTGNGMLGGQSFGDALVQGGLDQAWKQGLAGGAIGGAFGGLDAVSGDRNFWTGNFKQYDLEPALLASNNNMITDEYVFPDDATVANADDYRVYYRTEDGVAGTRNYVKSGKYIKNPVDGVATSKYTDQVFKIPDGGNVYVSKGGNVRLSFSTIDKVKLAAKQLIDPSYQYGWLNKSYFQNINAYDKGWQYLYRIAPLISKFPVGY